MYIYISTCIGLILVYVVELIIFEMGRWSFDILVSSVPSPTPRPKSCLYCLIWSTFARQRVSALCCLDLARKVDVRRPGKGNSNSHGSRPVHRIITMKKRTRTSRLSILNSLFSDLDPASSSRRLDRRVGRHVRLHHPSEEGTTSRVWRTFTWEPRPEFGLDCLICSKFARQRRVNYSRVAYSRHTSHDELRAFHQRSTCPTRN